MPSGTRQTWQPCPEALWRQLCLEDQTCTFYQTPDWLQVTAAYLRAQGGLYAEVEVAPLCLETQEGKVVLPLLRRRRYGAWIHFAPFGTYSAPLFAGVLSKQAKAEVAHALSTLNVLLPSSPFTPNAVQVGQVLPYAVQAVNLVNLDPANPMRDWEEGQQRRVRVSRRSGVTIRRAVDEKDWRQYYALYEESLARWGENTTSVYSYALFDALRQRLDDPERMSLWLAEVPMAALSGSGDSVIAAGYLTFYHNRHVVPWHGAGSKEMFRFGVTQALFHHMMADAARRGFTYFDLTGSSGLRGVAAFKSRFGTQEMLYEGSLNQVGLYGLLARCKSALSHLMPQAGPKGQSQSQSNTEKQSEADS